MPVVILQTFNQRHGGATGRPTRAFRWENNPAEDQEFIDLMQSTGSWNNVTIERPEVGSPRVLWDDGSSAPTQLRKIGVGSYWHPAPYNSATLDYATGPGPLDPGYWECDEYGRPLNVSDLQSEQP